MGNHKQLYSLDLHRTGPRFPKKMINRNISARMNQFGKGMRNKLINRQNLSIDAAHAEKFAIKPRFYEFHKGRFPVDKNERRRIKRNLFGDVKGVNENRKMKPLRDMQASFANSYQCRQLPSRNVDQSFTLKLPSNDCVYESSVSTNPFSYSPQYLLSRDISIESLQDGHSLSNQNIILNETYELSLKPDVHLGIGNSVISQFPSSSMNSLSSSNVAWCKATGSSCHLSYDQQVRDVSSSSCLNFSTYSHQENQIPSSSSVSSLIEGSNNLETFNYPSLIEDMRYDKRGLIKNSPTGTIQPLYMW